MTISFASSGKRIRTMRDVREVEVVKPTNGNWKGRLLGFLKQIPERAWDISKVVIPQVLLAYLKAHGYIGG